ncbi:MAG: multicopper oxidase type 2 [Edaphobacter sp.]|nr:multicopper oxidase type 2 [Edaphobacter sp.]
MFRRIVFILLAALPFFGMSGPAVLGQVITLPQLPQVTGPLTLTAITDSGSGKSHFRYNGSDVPPTIRVRPGQSIHVEYINALSRVSKERCVMMPCSNRSNLHFHGLHVSPQSPQDDVLTMSAAPGETLRYTVSVPPNQPPGLYWYHTHQHMESYRQDLDGMSGAIVVEGIDRYFPELRYMEERIMVLRDAELDEQGPERSALMRRVSLQAPGCGSSAEQPERVFTVNGMVRPEIDISPGEHQFWRIVNASPDLYADIQIDGSSFDVVALDGMPFAFHEPNIRSRRLNHVLLAPAGRMEAIVIGPPAGEHATLHTRCFDTGSDGDPNPAMVLADLVPNRIQHSSRRIVKDTGAPVYEPVPLAIEHSVEQAEPQFTAVFTEDKNGFYINGKKFTMDSPPMLTVQIGSYEHWRVSNQTNEVHPFHIHQVHFLVYARNGERLHQPEWLDTVNVPTRGSVDLVMDFTDPIIRGMSLFHCHLLNHEDKGMMAKVAFQ